MIVFWAYTYLAIFCAGIMLVLQLQHFALYPLAGKENFAAYIGANNRAAIFPAITSALVLTVLSIALLFERPAFLPFWGSAIGVALNAANLISTILWQGRMHGKLAVVGYDEALVRRLVQTNWIRTIALLLQSILVLATLLRIPGLGG